MVPNLLLSLKGSLQELKSALKTFNWLLLEDAWATAEVLA
jgi:hypothetical protein